MELNRHHGVDCIFLHFPIKPSYNDTNELQGLNRGSRNPYNAGSNPSRSFRYSRV